jgi:hypothetical protein
MGQLIATILNVIVLLVVPLGVVQLHAVMQLRGELIDVSVAATKYISNHGGTSDADVLHNVREFIREELAGKAYHIKDSDIQLQILRTRAADQVLWSHEDEFHLRLSIPYPHIANLFVNWEKPITVERIGTINVMDYDL